METLRRFSVRHGWACFGVLLFAVCALLVFWDALPPYAAIVSPDSGPFFPFAYRTQLLERLLGGHTFTPHTLYWLVFPPLAAHELTYILDSLMLALGGVFYLRGRGAHPAAAWFGGLALGLCGYTFTLFAAGHRGYYHMFGCAVWAFGLLTRCFETKRLFYFAGLGLVLAWGATCQPDVLLLLGGVAGLYALWLTFRTRREVGKRIMSVWPRFAVSVFFLAAAGFASLRSTLTVTMANRDAQIANVAAAEKHASGQAAAGNAAQAAEDRWRFATGWSLPPEDALEFIAPGVFGDESMQMPYPYWGRLGRPADELFQKGRMMPNYRGHTVYLGVLSVAFAIFGVSVWFAGGRRGAGAAQTGCDASDVPFWVGVWAVCFVLSLGRYTPAYRVFYALPYMDYIRAPVKFHHLVELSTAMLAGFGMDAFIRAPAGLRRRLLWVAGGLAGVLLVAAGAMLAMRGDVVKHIASLGLGQVAEALGDYAVRNLMRSVCLAASLAGLAWWASRQLSERILVRAACAVLMTLALEQALVAKRFVRVLDVAPFYQANAVVSAIRKEAGDRFVNVVNYATPNDTAQDWFSSSLSVNGIRNIAPRADEREAPIGKLFSALAADPLRLWRLCGVEYVILSREGTEALVQAGVLIPVLDFELARGAVRQTTPGAKSLMLARVRGIGGLPRLVTNWTGGVPQDRQGEEVARDRPDVTDAPSPAAPDAQAGGEVKLLASRGRPGVFATRVRVAAKAPGLLIFNERLDEDREILVDGRPVDAYVADCCWPAALVPQGEHEIVLRRKRNLLYPLTGVLAALAFAVWGAVGRPRARQTDAAV